MFMKNDRRSQIQDIFRNLQPMRCFVRMNNLVYESDVDPHPYEILANV